MSFDELMQHAQEIRQKAVQKTMELYKTGLPKQDTQRADAYRRSQVERAFADIPDLFVPFREMPEPTAFGWMIDQLDQALLMLSRGAPEVKDSISGGTYKANTELDKLGGTESYIEKWSGPAAREFKETYIDPFDSMVHNQFLITAVLKGALEAEREIWARAQRDIDQIAHDVTAALDALDECGPNRWSTAFTVVGAVISVPAAGLSGASAVALSAVAAAATVAAEEAPPPVEIRFHGETPEAIVSEMREAITKLIEYIHDRESAVSNALHRTYQIFANSRKDYVAHRPALANATEQNIKFYMGYAH